MKTSIKDKVYELLQSGYSRGNIISVNRDLVAFCDNNFDTAILLSQLLCWDSKTENEFIYKTYNEWFNELGLSEYKVRKSTKYLSNLGIVETKIKKAPNGNPTVHYRIIPQKITESLLEFLSERSQKKLSNEAKKNTHSLNTETTTEKQTKGLPRTEKTEKEIQI